LFNGDAQRRGSAAARQRRPLQPLVKPRGTRFTPTKLRASPRSRRQIAMAIYNARLYQRSLTQGKAEESILAGAMMAS